MPGDDRLDEALIRERLARSTRDRLSGLRVFDSIDSTNRWLCEQRAPLPEMIDVAIADFQTAGRGRRGRHWQIPPGHGLCLSVGMSIRQPPSRIAAFTLAIGLAVSRALEGLGVSGVRLKWPNDLVLDDGKLGGILCEMVSATERVCHVVAGIGINVRLPPGFSPGVQPTWGRGAVSIADVCGPPPARNSLAAAIIGEIPTAVTSYESRGFSPFMEAWGSRDWLTGNEIVLSTEAEKVRGRAAGVDETGALLVESAGQTRSFVAGEVCRCETIDTENSER